MKKMVLLLAVALILPGVAAAQHYEYAGREGKMMLVGDMALKRLEQRKAQKETKKEAQKETKKEQTQKAASQKSQGAPYYYYGREGKMLAASDMMWKRLEQRKAQKKAQKGTQKKPSQKAAAAKSEGMPHYYYGREGKMMLLSDRIWNALKKQSDKAAAKAATQQDKQTKSEK